MTTPGRKELVEGLDVGGDAGHQPSDRIAVEVRDAEPLQVLEDLEPKVAHDALADVGRDQRLHVLQHELEEEGAERDERQGAQHAEVALGHGDVERALGQQRVDQRQSGRCHEAQQRQRRLPAIGAEVPHQPAQQGGVVGRGSLVFGEFSHRNQLR